MRHPLFFYLTLSFSAHLLLLQMPAGKVASSDTVSGPPAPLQASLREEKVAEKEAPAAPEETKASEEDLPPQKASPPAEPQIQEAQIPAPPTPPRVRLAPSIPISASETGTGKLKLLIEIDQAGRATSVTAIISGDFPDSVKERVVTGFKNEALYLPATQNGSPIPGRLEIEVKLDD